ncbi:MAG: ribosome biogenesis GTPase YlqF [Erysipelotrichaceae bacterium]|nr:ribosome biogenesis GTPase YlqF [Erysipelotrichaceae bacterium]
MSENKTNINWFPGHMTKAKREMAEKMKLVDMVIEIRDARIPNASKNPMIQELCGSKPRLIILSKKDKAEENVTQKWLQQLSNDQVHAIALDLLKDDLVKILTNECQLMMKDKIERQIRRGIRPTAIRAMVVGIPNVGKSTLINRLAKRKAAQTGDRPGVTRSLQWVKVSTQLELLDTPGVLWPKFENQKDGYVLAVTGAIRDEILPMQDVFIYAMKTLIQYYPNYLQERYDITVDDDPFVTMERIARKRGFLMSGNEIDEERTMKHILKEIRQEQLGRISWEHPDADTES